MGSDIKFQPRLTEYKIGDILSLWPMAKGSKKSESGSSQSLAASEEWQASQRVRYGKDKQEGHAVLTSGRRGFFVAHSSGSGRERQIECAQKLPIIP